VHEHELLAHIYARSADLTRKFPRVVAGPGDDCAAVTAEGVVLLKVDQLVEGRHFRPDAPIDLIARKAVARPVSDIAAAGGTPVAAVAAAVLPAGYMRADALFDAMARWAERFACPLVGGDICTGAELSLSVSVMGDVHPVRGMVRRNGARPGDHIYVTGRLGGSLDRQTGLGRHFMFEPRLAEAKWLCDTLGAKLHAMMDLSDGLGRDGARLAAASGARLRLDSGLIPRSEGLADWRRAVSDGEDYELLFAVEPGAAVPAVCPVTGTAVTRIGTVEAGSGCVAVESGFEIDTSAMGWDHG
jgi:thiamine-monophosphate kinase